jgi:hypothetical protein
MSLKDVRTEQLRRAAVALDAEAWAFYLRVPRSHVVLLQAYFELYDGVGTVRTITGPEPIVCVLTTSGHKDDCINVLEALREEVEWELTSAPQEPAQ